jgi:cyclopropane-fatty-acyl-phospholipid synthase
MAKANDRARSAIEKLLAKADVRVDGDRPWDIQVRDERFYRAIIRGGTMAFGESYMAGWWDSDALDELVARLLSCRIENDVRLTPGNVLLFLETILSNAGTKARAFEIGRRHYDIGNDLFERMLDHGTTYTCGYWRNAKNLDEAQEAKLDLVCRKLGLRPGQKVLDIGCGWGSFAKFAAERYGVSVTGITVSKEQVALGKKLCKGLSVELLLQDYRDITGSFDHIVSLGMFEHVGYKNYRTYMRIAHDHLKDEGLFLLHTIGSNVSLKHTEPWMHKYIFPNGMVPSIAQIGKSIENLFVMEDWQNFGADYDRTLMAWYANFNKHWREIGEK